MPTNVTCLKCIHWLVYFQCVSVATIFTIGIVTGLENSKRRGENVRYPVLNYNTHSLYYKNGGS